MKFVCQKQKRIFQNALWVDSGSNPWIVGGGGGRLSAPLLSSPTKFSTVSQSSFPNLEFLFQFFQFSFFFRIKTFLKLLWEKEAQTV